MMRSRSSGLSLIELMVAMVLGLLLIAGVIEIFVQSKHGYRVQESSARMQESARFALDALGRDLRHADFWGGVDVAGQAALPPELISDSATPCSLSWFADYRYGIGGYDGAVSSPLPTCTVSSYQAQTDVLVIRHADPNNLIDESSFVSDPADEMPALLFRGIVGRGGLVFTPAQRNAAKAALSGDQSNGVFNYGVRGAAYYIATFKSGGVDRPTLYINASDTSNSQPLVEGIEQLQIAYGLDTDSNDIVDRYAAASALAPADWARVISVRVGIIARGDTSDARDADANVYAMPGGYDFTPATSERFYPRKLFVRDFQLRNRTRQ